MNRTLPLKPRLGEATAASVVAAAAAVATPRCGAQSPVMDDRYQVIDALV